VKVIVVNLAQVPVDIRHLISENVSATTSTSTTEESNISVRSVLEMENLAVERRENTKKPILNMDLLILLLTATSAHNI
jgi:hypothetical protein